MPETRATDRSVVFAHASEAEIARLLDFYGVRWQYEVRSFPLEWADDGRVTMSFTPDFYLPDYDLFLEVTTLKPGLTNRKNRKIRRLRELYPDVLIRLLALKDVEALMLKYGRHAPHDEADRAAHAEAEPAGGEGQAIKSLSDMDSSADFADQPSPPSARPSVPTDLSTRQIRMEFEEQ